MGLNINLRGDLAKLNDEELAARLKEAWESYHASEQRLRRWWWALGPRFFIGRRGPIRHPRVYRFFAAVQGTSGDPWLTLLFGAVFSRKETAELLSHTDPNSGMHTSLCEIRDIVDEAERRITLREGRKS